MIKKGISTLLAFAMLVGLCACGGNKAAAESVPAGNSKEETAAVSTAAEAPQAQQSAGKTEKAPVSEAFSAPECGFVFTYPEEYQNAKGIIRMVKQDASKDTGSFLMYYFRIPEEEKAAFLEYEKSLGEGGLTVAAVWEKGYQADTLFWVFADKADGAMAKAIENDMIHNGSSEGMIYVGQTKVGGGWYCSLMRDERAEADPAFLKERLGDYFDEYISFARNRDLVLSGFSEA